MSEKLIPPEYIYWIWSFKLWMWNLTSRRDLRDPSCTCRNQVHVFEWVGEGHTLISGFILFSSASNQVSYYDCSLCSKPWEPELFVVNTEKEINSTSAEYLRNFCFSNNLTLIALTGLWLGLPVRYIGTLGAGWRVPREILQKQDKGLLVWIYF